MNRSMLAATVALTLGAFASTGPAFAQSSSYSEANSSSQSTAVNATSTSCQSSARQLVNDAVPVIQKIQADSHYSLLLKQAKGIFIMPELVKGAFLAGGQG